MYRGVNKRVIEIIDQENRYFEKAILFVRPSEPLMPPEKLDSEAREYLSAVTLKPAPMATKLKKRSPKLALKIMGAVLAVAAVITLLLVIL